MSLRERAGRSAASDDRSLRTRAVRGAAWSGVSSIVLRAGSLVVGIILARILTPEQFGVFAIALAVQSIVMTVADLGLSSDLVRSEEPERIAPTIATLGLITGVVTTTLTMVTSTGLAELLGSVEAAPALAILSLTLFLAGVSIVPYAMMLRRFQQRELFWIGVVDFVVYTTVTLTLVASGFGVIGLAIGRVAAQLVASILQFVVAGVRPRFGLDRERLRPILAFGLPIATANLIAWALLNVDNIVLARMAGVTALGFYTLAFNISSWPMTALSQVVRSISLPYFSRTDDAGRAVSKLMAIGWALALPTCGLLAALSAPVISVLYGERWLPAAPVLAALGIYGALRVVFDIATGFLYAQGRSRPVLYIQIVWIVLLTVGMITTIPGYGIEGAAWVHVAVSVIIILPMHLIVLRASGVRIRQVLRDALPPTLGAVPAIAVAVAVRMLIDEPLVALLVGGVAAVAVYGAAMWSWGRRELHLVRGGA